MNGIAVVGPNCVLRLQHLAQRMLSAMVTQRTFSTANAAIRTHTFTFCDMVAVQVLFTSHEPMKLIAYYLVSQHNLNSRRFSVYAMSLVWINSIPTCERFTIARKISPLSRLAVFQMPRMDQMADSLNCRAAVDYMYIHIVVKRKVPVAARATPWLQSHNACHGQMPITTKASQLHTRYMGHTFYTENVFRCTVCVRKLLNIDFNYNSFNALDGSDASQYMQHQRNSSSHQIHAYIPARTMALCSFVAADAVGRNISTPQNKAKWKRYIDI